MKTQSNLGAIALLTATLVLAGGLSPSYASEVDEQVSEPAPTAFDDVWVPDDGAVDPAPLPDETGEIPPVTEAPESPAFDWSDDLNALDEGEAEVGEVASRAPAGTPIGAPGLGELPYFSFDEINLSIDTVARVNLGNGNLLLTASDGVLADITSSVRNDRFYNGLSSSFGSFGSGWSSSLSAFDIGLVKTSTQATVTGTNGYKAVFTKDSSGNWVAPAGYNATLAEDAPSNTTILTFNRTGERTIFNASGWVTRIADRNGHGPGSSTTPQPVS